MRVLAGRVAGIVIFGRIVDAERSARLHGIRRKPVVMDLDFGDMRGLGNRLVGRCRIAEFPVEDQIVRRLRMDLRRTSFQRIHGLDDGRQLLIVDLYGFGRIARLAKTIGHDDRDGIADIADDVDRQGSPGAHIHRRPIPGMDHPAADQIADAIGEQLLAFQYADHAGHGKSRRRIDVLDLCMCMRAADEIGVFHSRRHHVVGVAPLARQKSLVFLARHTRTNAFNAHHILHWGSGPGNFAKITVQAVRQTVSVKLYSAA